MKTRMKPDEPLPPETIRRHKRKNRLWLVVVPPLLSLSLVSIVKPAGRTAFAVEVAIILLCSFLCGFALAVRSFKTARQRFWGGLFFSGSSLYLISCMVFLGCMSLTDSPRGRPMTPAETKAFNNRQDVENRIRVTKQLVPRDARADAFMLDLSAFYNKLLPGQGEQPKSSIHYLDPGTHTWLGVKFDARGMVQPFYYSAKATCHIPVGQKCSEIDFLHGALGSVMSPSTVSRFVIQFTNGVKAFVPIVYEKDMAESGALEFARQVLNLTNSVVWEERNLTNAPPEPVFGFYVKKWSNPFPNETVESIDFESVQNYADVFLVAITVQPPAGKNP
jgi:hypothetical protein